MSEEEKELSPEEQRLVEFYNEVNKELQKISLERHGELIGSAQTVAHAIFWSKCLDTHFPELIPVAEAFATMIVMRGDRVANKEEGEKIKKRYIN